MSLYSDVRIVWLVPIAGIWWVPVALAGYSGQPVPGRTGGFGGPTCHACHTGSPLNAPGGELVVAGLPARYMSGATYRIRVQVNGAGFPRAGFSLAARFASGTRARGQAGTWKPADRRVVFVLDQQTKVQYAQHATHATRANGTGTIVWEVEWTAPDESEPVQFNIAATLSNDDGSPLGDQVYTRESRAAGPLR